MTDPSGAASARDPVDAEILEAAVKVGMSTRWWSHGHLTEEQYWERAILIAVRHALIAASEKEPASER